MTLTNIELFELAQKMNIKLDDVIMKDNLKDIPLTTNMDLIVNLESSNKGNGTHWIGLIIRKKSAMYFDSFGAIPPKEVISFCKGLRVGYNSYIIQDLKSTECGNYCLGYLRYIQSGKGIIYLRANEFINMFEDNTKLNDKILMKYLSS